VFDLRFNIVKVCKVKTTNEPEPLPRLICTLIRKSQAPCKIYTDRKIIPFFKKLEVESVECHSVPGKNFKI
jgi:hypothetical protein